MSEANVQIEDSWKAALEVEFAQPYFAGIKHFIVTEKAKGKRIFPPGPLIFNAFNLTPFDAVKVVVIGQDPYHGVGQAHGLCFSVQHGVAVPPSLKNIYKELQTDMPGFTIPAHGNLEAWAKQGVLLLNAVLTVNAGEPASHKAAGWEQFTNAVISKVSAEKEGMVFLLWGNFARAKRNIIDANKHTVLEAAHPSPLSGGAFFGCRHFSKTNERLRALGKSEINWQV